MTYSNEDLDKAEELHGHFHAHITAAMDKTRFSIDPKLQFTYPDIMNSCLITHLAHLERRIAELEKSAVTGVEQNEEKKM